MQIKCILHKKNNQKISEEPLAVPNIIKIGDAQFRSSKKLDK